MSAAANPSLTFTSIAKLHDRFAILISGTDGTSKFVYSLIEVALDEGPAEFGNSIRRGLAGFRRLSAEEQERAADDMASNPIASDIDEWQIKYVRVAVVAWDAGINLRGFAADSTSPFESHLPPNVSDEKLGSAVLWLFAECARP